MPIEGQEGQAPQTIWRPSVRQALVIAATTIGALGYAATLRYLAIEDSSVALTCDGGGSHWLCGSRKVALAFSQSSAFGAVALAAALLNLVRPSVVLVSAAILSAGFGLVLYNTATSAIAVAFLVLSLARSAPEPE